MKKYILNKYLKLLAIIIICINMYSCSNGVSKHELTSRVKADIGVEFTKRALESNTIYTINSFDLIHKGGNEYSGILETTEGGENFRYEVSVTTDGNSYLWKIVK